MNGNGNGNGNRGGEKSEIALHLKKAVEKLKKMVEKLKKMVWSHRSRVWLFGVFLIHKNLPVEYVLISSRYCRIVVRFKGVKRRKISIKVSKSPKSPTFLVIAER